MKARDKAQQQGQGTHEAVTLGQDCPKFPSYAIPFTNYSKDLHPLRITNG